jgi:general secretion pathway protein K
MVDDRRITLTRGPFSGLRPEKAIARERGGWAGPLVAPPANVKQKEPFLPSPRPVGEALGVRQSGAALLMALVVAAIATVIVSGLFWRQFVLVRTIENQQLMSQSRLLLRGALDWARSILREDAAQTHYTAFTAPWAQPLAETHLDQLGESSALASQATMSGSIEDAQSRFNLRNLVNTGTVGKTKTEHDVLARLASELSLPEPTADLITAYVQQTALPNVTPVGVPAAARPTQALPLVFPADLAMIPGLDPAVASRLAPYVVMLDQSNTLVNFNTASAEVIAAEVLGLSLSDARALVADRDRIPFNGTGDLTNRLVKWGSGLSANDASVSSQYFFVRGEIKLQRADTRMEALVVRAPLGQVGPVNILWEREL